jgi:predicted metal-dependent TIM-barrel fold hydrolase
MKLMDCHVHVEALNRRDLELMSLAGIEVIVSHTSLPEVEANIPSNAIFEFAERMLTYHNWRTQKYAIKTYVCTCVSMMGVPVDYEAALARLSDFIRSQPIVGIGEVRLEPASWTCPDLSIQEIILRAQLDLARDLHKPIAIHSPVADKARWVDRHLGMIKEHRLDPSMVIIDHADTTCISMVLDAGRYAAITVQPHRKARAADAAAMVKSAAANRELVDSDSSLNEFDSRGGATHCSRDALPGHDRARCRTRALGESATGLRHCLT